MRTAFLVISLSLVAFVVGAVVGVSGTILVQDYLAATVSATGVVRFESHPDPSASALPPMGYYIESSGIERVYIEHRMIASYLDQQIAAQGTLGTLCGPQGVNCYPVLEQASVRAIP